MSPDPSQLKTRLSDDMKGAMKSRDKPRLGAIRLILAAVKQQEVDSRQALDDSQILAVLDKMAKQRREALVQYQAAGRDDLASQEQFELQVISDYLPAALTEGEIDALIDQAISETGAATAKDMGKVMGRLKPKMQGRAEMSKVSGKVKARLTGS